MADVIRDVIDVPSALPAREDSSTDGDGASLWTVVNDRLRGRWIPAIAAGVLLSVLFGLAGFFVTTPKYESVAIIRIAPKISPILQETPETSMMPLYQNFVNTHATLLQSRRVLERALQDQALAGLSWSQRPQALDRLRKGLTVNAERGSELITVQFDAVSAEVAQAAVNAVVRGYVEIYGADGVSGKLQQLYTLRQERRTARNQIKADIQRYVAKYGTDDLRLLMTAKHERLQELTAEQEQLRRAQQWARTEPGVEDERPGVFQLELADARLAELRALRDRQQIEFERIKTVYHPMHPEFKQAEAALAQAERRVEQRETELLVNWESLRKAASSDGRGAANWLTDEQLEAQLEYVGGNVDLCLQEMKELSADYKDLEELRSSLEYVEQELAGFGNRITELEIERDAIRNERISVASFGHLPTAPSRDRRNKLAAVGAVGGFGLSFGVFFLLGTVDRRAYGATQLRDNPAFRCLGVLPDLRGGRMSADACAIAAHCVHQIRNRIEPCRRGRTGGFVLAISSPYQGDGKTNIAMALGWSYAAAGNRTLLVDCDILSRRLSSQWGLGECDGLKEVLHNGRLDDIYAVCHAIVPNLDVLPAGTDGAFGPEMLREGDLQRLFDHLRNSFDMIIVDTGPMLASLEGLPVVSAADGTILSVRRGRPRPRLQECIDQIEDAGARYVGVVLNCADRSDCHRYASRSSLSALPALNRGGPDKSDGAAPASAEMNGQSALVRAMQLATTAPRQDD